MTEGTRPGDRSGTLSMFLIVSGIVMVFAAFLVVAVWQASWAIYPLLGGVAVLVLGFVAASRSR